MNKKIILFFILTAFICSREFPSFAQMKVQTFEQIDSLQKINNRNVVVFIHTDWCKYCQLMKNTTFKNDNIISTISNQFWFTELNAEEKRDIKFNEQIFKYKPTGSNTGTHELAEQLATIKGELSYPSICVLNSNYEIIFQHNEFLSSSELLNVLKEINKSP